MLAGGSRADAQGWPANYEGVMLQGFYWDSYTDTQWTNLEKQADELSQYFSLIWIPQSGNCNTSYNNMGYMPVYYYDQNSSFGTESQLRSMINTFKQKGTGLIADVVINHRNNLGAGGSWVDFPKETYKGVTYQMLPTDICANDDNGATKTWATGKGIQIGGNNDTGEDWSGCRDLDHKSANVQKCIDAYLDYLLNDLGYAGFRYDMTKGYSASYTGQYNAKANPTYSVGEYWDGNVTALRSWITGTTVNGAVQSSAFDFPFRYTVRDAVNAGDWTKLANASLLTTAAYRRYSVTFVENHDTQYRSATEQQDPIKKDTLAANAFMLAMPGTPCVFLTHWKAYKQEIKAMIDARKTAGIHNQSVYSAVTGLPAGCYGTNVTGKNGNLIVVVGANAASYTAPAGFVKILSGYHYAYYISTSVNTAWADKASGEYADAFNVQLTAVTGQSGAQLVYTLDGTTPTAASNKAASGTNIMINNSCTLKVGLLVGNTVTGVITRTYTVKPFVAHTATVYLKSPGWSNVYFYAWDDAGVNLLGVWPGKAITATKVIDGETWYYSTFNINKAGYRFNIIFNQGQGKSQTVDIGPIDEDVFYEIAALSSGKYTVTDVTDQHSTTGITGVGTEARNVSAVVKVYTIDGRLLRTLPAGTSTVAAVDGLQHGIYIVNGKKISR